jgi:hypothetical protein
MAVIVVPHNIDKSGRITVVETMIQIDALISHAQRVIPRRTQITLHRKRDGEAFRIGWALIQAIEKGGGSS